MTLLEMENRDDVLDALKNFSREKCASVPPVLDNYLKSVAATGKTCMPWNALKPLLLRKFQFVVDEHFGGSIGHRDSPLHANTPDVPTEELKGRLDSMLEDFHEAPFTIQRLCEMLIDPNRDYSRLDKFLRGMQKILLVISCVDPNGEKIREHEPWNNNGDVGDNNESMIGSESPKNSSLEASNSANNDSDMMISGTPVKNTNAELATPSWMPGARPAITFRSPATAKALSAACAISPAYRVHTESENRLSTGSTESSDSDVEMSDAQEDGNSAERNPSRPIVPPIDQMLRPIGQLEAFVQNLAPSEAVPRTCLSPTSKPILPFASEAPTSVIFHSPTKDTLKSSDPATPTMKARKRDSSVFEDPGVDDEEQHENAGPSPSEDFPKPSPSKLSKLDDSDTSDERSSEQSTPESNLHPEENLGEEKAPKTEEPTEECSEHTEEEEEGSEEKNVSAPAEASD